MSRTLRRLAAVLALSALAFAQLAVAAYACPKGLDGQVRAVVPSEPEAPTCPDLANPNLCERHCDYGASSVTNHPVPFTGPDLAPLPWSAVLLANEGSSLRVPTWRIARSTALPPSARLARLQI